MTGYRALSHVDGSSVVQSVKRSRMKPIPGRDCDQHERMRPQTISSSFADDGRSMKSSLVTMSFFEPSLCASLPAKSWFGIINVRGMTACARLTSHMNMPKEHTSLPRLNHPQSGASHALAPWYGEVKRLKSGIPLGLGPLLS